MERVTEIRNPAPPATEALPGEKLNPALATQPAITPQASAKIQMCRISLTKAEASQVVSSLLGLLLNPPENWQAAITTPINKIQVIQEQPTEAK